MGESLLYTTKYLTEIPPPAYYSLRGSLPSNSCSAPRTHSYRRACRRPPEIHPRNHGACSGVHCRSRLGRGSHGHDGAGRGMAGGSPSYTTRLAGSLACGSIRGCGDCSAGGRDQGSAGKFVAVHGSGKKVRIEFRTPDFCGRPSHLCHGSIRGNLLPAGYLAVVIRHRHRDGRRIFRARSAHHGPLPHGTGCRGLVLVCAMGQLVHGGGIWPGTDCLWNLDRTAVRRLRRR